MCVQAANVLARLCICVVSSELSLFAIFSDSHGLAHIVADSILKVPLIILRNIKSCMPHQCRGGEAGKQTARSNNWR